MISPSDQSRPSKSRSSGRRRKFALLAGAFLLTIVLLTMLPAEAKHVLHTRGRFHSAGHILAFAALAFAAGRSSRSWKSLLLLFLCLICFGFSTEFVEHVLYKLDIEWIDVGGDSIGVAIGFSLALLTTRGRRRAARLHSHERWV